MTNDCGATNRNGNPCSLSAGWGTDHNGEGRCKFHGGATSGGAREGAGAPKGNDNAATHRLNSNPSLLYENLEESRQDIVDELRDSIVDQLAERWGGLESVPATHVRQARRIAMNMLKVTVLAEEWQAKQAEESGNPLMERETRTSEQGHEFDVDVPSKVESIAGDLSRENRMWLKDMGILGSPEEQQADAASEVAAAWEDAAAQWRMKRVENEQA